MRRIVHLEQQDEPTLPDLPSFGSEDDVTYPDSPEPVRSSKILPAALGSVKQSATASYNNNNDPPTTLNMTSYSYTSTPAPSSSSLRSNSTQSTAASTTQSEKTTVGKPSINQHYPRSLSSASTLKAAIEEEASELPELPELPSFDRDDASSIGREDELEQDREDMVVLSGSGEEGSVRNDAEAGMMQKLRMANTALPTVPSTLRDYMVPVSSGESDSDSPPLRRTSANVSIRRKSSFKSARPSDENNVQQTPYSKMADPSTSNDLPSTFSPLRDIGNGSFPSPELGRHASPVPSPHSAVQVYEPFTPSSVSSGVNSKFYSTPVGDLTSRTDAERRKEHLLATLRSTSKPRMAKGTPHPQHRRRTPHSAGHEREDDEASLSSSSGTSHDLTTNHHGNTSLPSGGAGGLVDKVGGGGTGGRFNGAKLNVYLHSLNNHLTDENTTLSKTLSGTTKEVGRLRNENKKLDEKIREMSLGGMMSGSVNFNSTAEEEERTNALYEREQRVEALEKQFSDLVQSHGGIIRLKEKLVDGLVEGDSLLGEESKFSRLERTFEQVQELLESKEREVVELRDKVVRAQSGASGSPGRSSSDPELVESLQHEIFELKDQLGDANSKSDEVSKWKNDFSRVGEENAREMASLNERIDDLLLELEEKDNELENARGELSEQELEFGDKMQSLEVELCRVMEEQEGQLEKAKSDLEEKRREDEKVKKGEEIKLGEARRKIHVLEDHLKAVEDERNDLERKLVGAGTGGAGSNDFHLVTDLREQIMNLEQLVEEKDDELAKMNLEFDEAEAKFESIEQEQEAARRDASQMEEALDESARQILQYEEDLEIARSALASEKTKIGSLSAQISVLSAHKTKAKSPLGNEVFSHSRDAMLASLEEELNVAKKEIRELQNKLEAVQSIGREGGERGETVEIKDLRIRTLEGHQIELENRVQSLRKQVSIQSTPMKTPEKSILLRSIIGVATPRTPGQFLNDLPNWSPGSESGDMTISPLLAQIHELQIIVSRLQLQLSEANISIDHKLEKLEAAGSGTIALARQLAEARERIARLESELERLLGEGGSMERIRERLTRIECPGCNSTFDANRSVRLTVDRERNELRFEGSTSSGPQITEALRTALAGVNAKLSELKTENSVLQDASSRAKDLSRKHKALQTDFDVARTEIAKLETELRTERTRLRTLSSEHSSTVRSKVSLESRLAVAEQELRVIKRELADTSAPDSIARLRKEKDGLVSERSDLLSQLAEMNEHVSKVDSELTFNKLSQTSMRTQLDHQITEMRSLRDALETGDSQRRLLQDERGDILRKVSSLHSDLSRVRQDALSLGTDLTKLRNEREHGRNSTSGAGSVELQAELEITRKRLAIFEKKISQHVCLSDADALAAAREQSSQEAKGLLVMIRYLKIRVTREATFRGDMSYQKEYLGMLIREKQEIIDTTRATLSALGLSRPVAKARTKFSFKSAAVAVMAITRMSKLSREWRKQSASKTQLRSQAYPDVRGRPFAG